jgi:hypothetical protein
MRSALGPKVMSFDAASKALADGLPGDVNLLSDGENGDADMVTRLEGRELVRGNRELLQDMARLNTGLGEVPRQWLVDARGTAFPESHLDDGVTIILRRFDLGDPIVRHIEHGYRDTCAVVGKNARHADLAPNKAKTHVYSPLTGYDWPASAAKDRAVLMGCPAKGGDYSRKEALLQLNFDVDTCRQIKLHQGVNGLVSWINDIHQAKMGAYLELVT